MVEEIEFLLDGSESAEDRSAAAEKLDQIAMTYEGTSEAAEALRILRAIRAEEEQERREIAAAKTQEDTQARIDTEKLKQENDAAAKLRLAKVFLASGKTSHARRWFEDVIRQYPNTLAASEACNLLVKMPQQYID